MTNYHLGSYLGGLFDYAGTIFFPRKPTSIVQVSNTKIRTLSPKFRILFDITDLGLAKHLIDNLGFGRLFRLSSHTLGIIEFCVKDVEGLWKISQIINGKLRTSKIRLCK